MIGAPGIFGIAASAGLCAAAVAGCTETHEHAAITAATGTSGGSTNPCGTVFQDMHLVSSRREASVSVGMYHGRLSLDFWIEAPLRAIGETRDDNERDRAAIRSWNATVERHPFLLTTNGQDIVVTPDGGTPTPVPFSLPGGKPFPLKENVFSQTIVIPVGEAQSGSVQLPTFAIDGDEAVFPVFHFSTYTTSQPTWC